MSHRTVRGRLALTSLLSAVALLAIALPSGATTNPEEVGGNPTCADLGYNLSFKIDTGDLQNKTYKAGAAAVATNWSVRAYLPVPSAVASAFSTLT